MLDAESDGTTVVLSAHLDHQLVIGVQYRDAVWLQAFDQLCLRRRHVFDGTEVLQVHRRYHQLHADIRRRDLAESLNLVCRRRHAHLQHGDVELVG